MNKDTILGFNNRKIKVEFETNENINKIYILYPGSNYGFESPLFYYLKQLLKKGKKNFYCFDLKWDELGENSDYTFEEILPHLKEEIISSLKYVNKLNPKEIVIIGKSIGTIALETSKNYKEINKIVSKYIWLTPFKNTSELTNYRLEKELDYIYVGNNDTFYKENIYKELSKRSTTRIYKDLDHSFNSKEDYRFNINSLINILKDLEEDIL